MKHTFSFLIACLIALPNSGQDTPTGQVQLEYPKSDVQIVLEFYERVTGKPVFKALDLEARVTIQTKKRIAVADAIELIRTTLLERYGIEFRTTDQGDTLVGWSKDPKHPRRSES